MQILNVYKKDYKCSKCDSVVEYGQVADDKGVIITKDKKPFNNQYGKGSNVLSAAVDKGTNNLHPCYASYVLKDFDELTGIIQSGPLLTESIDVNVEGYDGFISTVKNVYIKLYYESGKLCGEGATAKDKHITTMGLIHDYFSYRNLK